MPSPPALDLLRAPLRDRDALALVVLFGSVAAGTARPDSDLDVAVLPAGDWSASDEAELIGALEDASGREIDLVRLDHVDDLVLRREIARGVALREARPGLFARFRAEATLAWLDLEPTYLRAQASYLRRIARGARGAGGAP